MDLATSFLDNFTIFILAIFVGYHVVWNVTPALHTPLWLLQMQYQALF